MLRGDPLVAAARPVLEAEAQALGETVFLTAARAGRIAVLEKAEGRGFLRAAPQVGGTVPVHATAVGKLQLAFAPDEIVIGERASTRSRPRRAPRREALAREVELARRRGFAENRDEWIPGLAVVAAPVLVARPPSSAASRSPSPTARLVELDPALLARRARRARRAAWRRGSRERGRAPIPSRGEQSA